MIVARIAGHQVVATARNSSKLSFPIATKDNLLALDCDVTNQSSIDAAFAKALAQADGPLL